MAQGINDNPSKQHCNPVIHPVAGLLIRFEVGGGILKVEGYGGQRPPTGEGSGGLGAAEAPSGIQGQSHCHCQKSLPFSCPLPKIAFSSEEF